MRQPETTLVLATGEPRGRFVRDHFTLATFTRSSSRLIIALQHEGIEEIVVDLDEHTFYELDQFAVALKSVPNERVPVLFGESGNPKRRVTFTSALVVPLAGITFYVSSRSIERLNLHIVDVAAISEGRAVCAAFEYPEILRFASDLSDMIRNDIERFV